MARLTFKWFLLALGGSLILAVSPAAAAEADARQAAGECARCHVISVAEWGCSGHFPRGVDCPACHGASQGHVRDERNNVKPDHRPRGAAVADLCRPCHTEGCPREKKVAACQECHHVHALIDPRKPFAARDEGREQLAARWRRRAQWMEEGERHVRAQRWESARRAFQKAREEIPGDSAAAARIKMCERRLNPGLAGFEIAGASFDGPTGLPRAVRVVELGIPMLLVAGGELDLGAEDLANARPVHTVWVAPFYLARHEVTREEWGAVMGAGSGSPGKPGGGHGGRLPMDNVSWADAQAFVRQLNARIVGGGFRLPTEAEWECAARAGGESGEAFDLETPREVERGIPNRLGFFDLAGNVREWCSSLLAPYPYQAADGREAGDLPGLRVLRGGSFKDLSSWYSPGFRHGERPSRRMGLNGFRLARDADRVK